MAFLNGFLFVLGGYCCVLLLVIVTRGIEEKRWSISWVDDEEEGYMTKAKYGRKKAKDAKKKKK